MWWASVYMAPFGLTEPLFVPEYWNPPSLFELAQKTGFDIESFIFSFAIGGIGAVLYTSLMRKRIVLVDLAGRFFKGVPAPINLVIPIHRYISDTVLIVGEDAIT